MAACTPLRWVRILPYRLLRLIAAHLRPQLQLEKPRRTAFSDAQATRGQAQYAQKCAACHMADLSGSGSAIPLAGASFTQTWSGHTLDELDGVISTTMPQGNAGGLSPGTYADIVAYILKANGLSPGQDELKSDTEMLRSIAIRF
jgi:mono/diheme cytochrome c family protein